MVQITWVFTHLIQKSIFTVGAKSDQQVNIYSFIVHCDRMWPSTQWHKIYTGSGNMPYVQFQSVGDFIPESKCSKFAVGLQTSRNKKGVLKARSDSEPKAKSDGGSNGR